MGSYLYSVLSIKLCFPIKKDNSRYPILHQLINLFSHKKGKIGKYEKKNTKKRRCLNNRQNVFNKVSAFIKGFSLIHEVRFTVSSLGTFS